MNSSWCKNGKKMEEDFHPEIITSLEVIPLEENILR
jgi:hypothetical protein